VKTTKRSPTLQSTAKTGKTKYWQLVAFQEDDAYYYQKVWWQEGSKSQSSAPVRVRGKNVGRANETTDLEQLLSEFDSIVQKQRDKGYSEDGSSGHNPVKPMLAHKYKDKKHKLTFPVWVQPKLDGFRMLKSPNGKVAWTRGGKEHVRECVKHLMWYTDALVVDGELMLPGNRPLQETASAAKKYWRGLSETLIYYVYDVVAPKLPFSKRYELLTELVKKAPPNVKLVVTVKVNNEQELFEAHAKITKLGFEGTIIRTDVGGYEVGHRSNSLLKLKDFQDAEFKIIGVEEGKGNYKGRAILVCETHEGNQFNVVPEGTQDYRAKLWQTRESLIGQWLTVRYQTLSKDGVPIFPVGVDFRERGEF
jgi:DNA ligase-1